MPFQALHQNDSANGWRCDIDELPKQAGSDALLQRTHERVRYSAHNSINSRRLFRRSLRK